jgi:hypothetical protein
LNFEPRLDPNTSGVFIVIRKNGPIREAESLAQAMRTAKSEFFELHSIPTGSRDRMASHLSWREMGADLTAYKPTATDLNHEGKRPHEKLPFSPVTHMG